MPKLSQLKPTEREQIAELVPMDPGSVRNISAGRRKASALTAILIERAARKLGLDIRRESMCEGCRKCEFAKAARKVK